MSKNRPQVTDENYRFTSKVGKSVIALNPETEQWERGNVRRTT